MGRRYPGYTWVIYAPYMYNLVAPSRTLNDLIPSYNPAIPRINSRTPGIHTSIPDMHPDIFFPLSQSKYGGTTRSGTRVTSY